MASTDFNEKAGTDALKPEHNNSGKDDINKEAGPPSDNGDAHGPRSETGSQVGLTAGHESEDIQSSDQQSNEKASVGPLTRRQKVKNRLAAYWPSDETLYGPNPEGIPLNKKQKFTRHYKKWWWAHLIGIIIILAIFLPILFELIIPAIVQDIVSSQSLPIHNGTLRAISPTLIEISLNSTINTPIPARLGSFPLALYVTNTSTRIPFLNVELPGQHISKNTAVTVTNQSVPFNNETEATWWLNELYDQTTVELGVEAHPEVFLGILHSRPHLKKTLTVPGLNMLSGIHIAGLQLIYPAMSNGYNINGTLVIPNAGVLGLGLGNISFNLMSGEVNLGLVHLYDVTLQPGNTTSYFEGELYFDQLLPNIGPILQSQAKALGDGQIQLNATGNSTMINGVHIPYIEAILNTKSIPLDISVITLLSDVLSGYIGAGNSSLIDALTETLDNKTLIGDVMSNWDPPLFYPNETMNATASRMKKRRAATRNSVMWNMMKLSMNAKRR